MDTEGTIWNYCILVFLRYLGHAFGGNAGQVSPLTGRSIAVANLLNSS